MIDFWFASLKSDKRVLRKHSSDFGNIVEKKPAIVACPRSLPKLRHCLAFAREKGLYIAFRGGGQSFFGQSLSERGMVLDMKGLKTSRNNVEFGDGWVEAPASMLMFNLLKHLRRKGLRLPVYTVATKATLGGTLAAGGISGRSFKRGVLANHVIQADIMGTDGRLWTCNADRNQDVFSCSVATMGAGGALLNVRLRTETLLPERVQMIFRGVPLENLSTFCRQFSSVPEITSLEGFLNIFTHPVTAEVYATMEAQNKSDISGKKELWQAVVKRFDLTPGDLRICNINAPVGFSASIKGWNPRLHDLKMKLLNKKRTVYVIPLSFAISPSVAVPFILQMSEFARELRQYFHAKPYFAFINATPQSAFEWVRLSSRDSHMLGIDIFFTFPHAKQDRAVRAMTRAAQLVADYTGRIYPYGFLPDTNLLTQLLPAVSDPMKGVMRKIDPGGYLRSSHAIGNIPG